MTPTLTDRVKDAVSEAEKTLSVQAIAKACNVSVQSVYNWRRGGASNLKGETLVELAEVSGLSARWIINGKGPKNGLSKDAKVIVEALPLISGDMRESWLDASMKAIAKAIEQSKSA